MRRRLQAVVAAVWGFEVKQILGVVVGLKEKKERKSELPPGVALTRDADMLHSKNCSCCAAFLNNCMLIIYQFICSTHSSLLS